MNSTCRCLGIRNRSLAIRGHLLSYLRIVVICGLDSRVDKHMSLDAQVIIPSSSNIS